MKYSVQWLKEFIGTLPPPEELQLKGFEVESLSTKIGTKSLLDKLLNKKNTLRLIV